MSSLTKRQQRIFDLFLESTEYLTSQKLSSMLNVSSKTVRTEIKNLNQVIYDFASIQAIPAKGYQLVIIDQNLFECFQRTLNGEKDDFIPTNPLERAYYILGLMLKEQDFIKIDDLSEMLYIDRTAISRSLKIIRKCLDRFGLHIVQRTGKGLKIEGDEFHYRQCMAEYIYHKPEMFITEIGRNEAFIDELKDVIFNDGITMPERVFRNFVIHIQVQLDRILNGCFIEFEQEEKENIENEYEHLVAKDVAELIVRFFDIELNGNEKDYLTIHILGKKSNSTSAIESCLNNQLKQEIDDIVQRMFDRIYTVFHIDFSDDMYLRKAIGIHIHPMENRLKFNTYLRNPLIHDIQEKYTYAYMMSLEAWYAISHYVHYLNVEDEIGYIAIHFQYALERRKRNMSKKRVLLVNDYSVAISELLNFSILKKYRDSLIIENTISASELHNYDLSQYDCLLTTVPIPTYLKIPVIRVNPIMTEKDLQVLQTFLQNDIQYSLNDYMKKDYIHCLSLETREDVYQYIYQQKHIPQEFELNHQILIQYIPVYQRQSQIFVYSLNKAILWKNKFVKVIFVLEIGYENEYMVESLQRFLSHHKNIENIMQAISQDELLNAMIHV